MLVTKALALAFAALVTAAPPQPGFKGDKFMVSLNSGSSSTAIAGFKVRSVEVDNRGQCSLYRGEQCDGDERLFTQSEMHMDDNQWRSVNCTRGRRQE
ncbi:hypothetical protein HRG_002800 [Hirsutella rhossiliensis]|uniref:Beta/gamma crystallin 'Greek key' domain-containing protein n=1 Tax=Hirsutella rhossiliensis TaxID=111463 RepID=A0A9P8N2R5_9HYPO|nr:uncharacterized protein HRG_02800 [Hirsutella rhossiliensis]KAH0964784.1 hypothetical protein HRG_02800 [Hirsutella rhossiliensis]